MSAGRAQWRRWRKYPVGALAVGAAARGARHLAWLLRLDTAVPELDGWPRDAAFAADLCGRLGLPSLRPGAGVPACPPFGPEDPAETLAQAERGLRREVLLLGRTVRLGASIDWHADLHAGVRWPLVPATAVPYQLGPGCDIKVPWELGRMQHLAPLARAYLLTGDARFAAEIRAQLTSFLEACPPGHGVQWASAMDVAIRAANLAYLLAILASGPDLPRAERDRLVRALAEHGTWVRWHLSWNPHSRGNHYLSEIVGLLHVGLALGWSRAGRSWARRAARAVREELAHQVRADGWDWESSTNYHRLVTELLAQARWLLRASQPATGLHLGEADEARIERMLDVVDACTRPDGSAPLLGDVDDGRLLAFTAATGARSRHHRESLAPYRAPADRPPPASRLFAESGVAILRAPGALVMLRFGPVGLNGRGAHDHADLLAVDATLGGVTLLEDPGTPVYTADPETRRRLRGTATHTTLTVDGADQFAFSPLTLFEVDEGRAGTLERWEAGTGGTTVVASHDNYARLPSPVRHRRRVHLAADGERLEIEDALEGPPARHAVRATFQWAAGVAVEPLPGDTGWCVRAGGRSFRLVARAPGALAWRLEPGLVSPGYGTGRPAPRLVCEGLVAVPLALTVTLEPWPVAGAVTTHGGPTS